MDRARAKDPELMARNDWNWVGLQALKALPELCIDVEDSDSAEEDCDDQMTPT
ncbi:hypothetical protein OC842_005209 [Tilletia horrida]|uniref:Uncharacterized protein n=1 Tax=Tilletia horrida TaxID=155126 RepID=A0AAN6G9I3_9BASI|nr:hypothetical protein OC842_005209 [Tilletia horrida]KAK0564264.1 hypothetical protein OC844_001808 [Tilletia horrida]